MSLKLKKKYIKKVGKSIVNRAFLVVGDSPTQHRSALMKQIHLFIIRFTSFGPTFFPSFFLLGFLEPLRNVCRLEAIRFSDGEANN